jgi:hypothetical protein
MQFTRATVYPLDLAPNGLYTVSKVFISWDLRRLIHFLPSFSTVSQPNFRPSLHSNAPLIAPHSGLFQITALDVLNFWQLIAAKVAIAHMRIVHMVIRGVVWYKESRD